MAEQRQLQGAIFTRPHPSTCWVACRRRAIALAFLAFVLPACAEIERAIAPGGEPSPRATEVAPGEAGTAQPTEQLDTLVGQVVTVRSEVVVAGDPNSFLLTDSSLLNGENVLVFNATGTPVLVPRNADSEVLVTGEVRQFRVADVERNYGITLDPETFLEYEQRPAIFAESIALAPDPSELTSDPQQFYNQTVAVNGQVDDISTPNTFTLVDPALFGGERVLVLNTTPERAIADGQGITVVGELRPFVVADIERDYDLTWDLERQQQLELEFRDQPVLVAREIYDVY